MAEQREREERPVHPTWSPQNQGERGGRGERGEGWGMERREGWREGACSPHPFFLHFVVHFHWFCSLICGVYLMLVWCISNMPRVHFFKWDNGVILNFELNVQTTAKVISGQRTSILITSYSTHRLPHTTLYKERELGKKVQSIWKAEIRQNSVSRWIMKSIKTYSLMALGSQQMGP